MKKEAPTTAWPAYLFRCRVRRWGDHAGEAFATWSTWWLTGQLSRPTARPALRPDMEVLRLMADGQTTAAIARDLAYSESTIKNIIHAIVVS